MKALVVFILVLCLANTVLADECTTDENVAIATLDHQSGLVKGSYKIERSDRHLVEQATLKNGVKVRYEVGGCVHYSFNWTFESLPKNVVGRTVQYQAIALLKMLPESDNARQMLQILKDAPERLERAGNDSFALPCGDAYCTLAKKDGALMLGYDFAL